MRKAQRGDVPMYDEDEVRDMAEKKSSPPAQPVVLPPESEPSQAIATGSDNADSALSQLVAIFTGRDPQRLLPSPAPPAPPVVTISDLSHKLKLSLDESAKLSGLSRGHLREAIRGEEIEGAHHRQRLEGEA